MVPAGSVSAFVERALEQDLGGNGSNTIPSLESRLEFYERQLLDLNKFNIKLSEEFVHKVEYHHLLMKSYKFLAINDRDLMARTSDDVTPNVVNSPFFDDSGFGSDEDEFSTKSKIQLTHYSEKDAFFYQNPELTFSNIAGVIPLADQARFDKMLYRATRGNCYVKFSPLKNKAVDSSNVPITKTCFIIFYKSNIIEVKIRKICLAFNANVYELKSVTKQGQLDQQIQDNHRELADAKHVLDKNNEARMRLCIEVTQHIEEWFWIVRREKSVFHTLNLFKTDIAGHSVLRGRGWMLTDSVSAARAAIRRAHINLNLYETAVLETVDEDWPTPPTHFETNKYTVAFQQFVNTYGTPRYKEINPALFTAATFPFLFGVMYGDIGHGSCLALAGFLLILTESQAELRTTGQMLKDIYVARYMIFAMGLSGMYAGLVYNDYFSLGLDLFGSKYEYQNEEDGTEATLISGKYGDGSSVYPFGVDPAWKVSSNSLLFFNSMKMKMSVILGIAQMTFGILLKGLNTVYFGNNIDFLFEFLPMIIFDISLFGYMVILIFTKWSINWQDRMEMGSCNYDKSGTANACTLDSSDSSSGCYTLDGQSCTAASTTAYMCPLNYGGTGDGCQPPNLITTLINIALKPGAVDEPMYSGQDIVQTILLTVAMMCVPALLLVKPLYLRHLNNKKFDRGAYLHKRKDDTEPSPVSSDSFDDDSRNLLNKERSVGSQTGGGHGHGEEFNFGEIFIHQAIETIEFVLGMVSNTASYLRLWALSLAHTELAEVFWEKCLLSMIETNNPILIFLGYAIFAMVTFAVLLAMDVLECFLHALRLHWVEFQNKFYKADGYAFLPFDFNAIVASANLE